MIHLQTKQSIIEHCRDLVEKINYGKRGFADGKKKRQFLGMICENTVRDYYGVELSKPSEGWDGGWDFMWKGMKTDVKSTAYKGKPKTNHRYRVIEDQMRYDAECFIFAYFNELERIVSITGWITKDDFLKKSVYNKKGDKMMARFDRYFYSDSNSYQLKILDLNPPLYNFE